MIQKQTLLWNFNKGQNATTDLSLQQYVILQTPILHATAKNIWIFHLVHILTTKTDGADNGVGTSISIFFV